MTRARRRVPRAVATAVAVAAVVAALAARAGAAERVVFCAPASDACAKAGTSLGATARGTWAVVDDRDLRSSAGAAAFAPRLLYFSRGDYEAAVAGLSARERERAVLRRLERMSAEAPARIFGLLHDDLVAVAAASARVAGDARGEAALEAAGVIAGGPRRFEGVRPAAAVQEVRRSLARLLVELPEGAAAAGYAREAAAWAALEAEVRGAGALAAPFAATERVYFVADMPAPRRGPLVVDMPTYGWRGGVVTVLRPADLNAPPWRTLRPRLVYYDRGVFLREVLDLTDAQLDRRLSARLAAPPARERAELTAALAFDHAVLARQYAAASRASGPSPRWDAAVALDGANLRRVLAAEAPAELGQLAPSLARLRDDLALAASLFGGTPASAADAARIERLVTLIGRH